MTWLEIARLAANTIYIGSLVALAATSSTALWLVIAHLRARKAGLAREAAILASELPPDDELPHVLVQIPTFNEGAIVRRGLEAAAALDWPRDRLHIQLLDDSTDETTQIGAQVVADLRARGLDIEMLHREDRAGFKAGALQEGIEKAPHPFVAILDVDYVPRPDFLKLAMRPLLADDRVALSQARFDFLNGDKSWLTRAQQLMLDAHLAIEQATRSWRGDIMPFNGTCGIWRREAIVDAGGWEGDTLAEDMDLSYRVHLKGWKSIFLVTVPVPGELPESIAVWTAQQHRWAKGFAQVSKKVLARVMASDLPRGRKIASFIHLGISWAMPVFGVAIVAGNAVYWLNEGLTIVWAPAVAALVFGIGTVVIFDYVAYRLIRKGGLGRFVTTFLSIPVLMGYSALLNIRGVLEAKVGKGSEFVRTPKGGVTET